ncbi:MAG: hypothetical protein R3E79_55730 [Caldilineaceae bacterium]
MSVQKLSNIQKFSTSRRFAINFASNLSFITLNILSGLWFTPYLIQNLGIPVYGVVILANSVTNYLSVVNSALSNSVGRFLALDIQKSEITSANRTFNTAFWSSIILLFILLPIIGVFTYFAPYIFDVPDGYEFATQWLFAVTMFSYLLVIVRSIFLSSTFARNRLDLQNMVSGSNTILRILVVIYLFSIATMPNLWHVGIGTVIGGIVSTVLAVIIWRCLTPDLVIDYHYFDKKRLQNVSTMSGWVFINQAGTLLLLNIDIIIVNMILGAEIGARYGTIFQWTILLRTFGQTASSALAPIILSQFAQNKIDSIRSLSSLSIRVMGLVIALPIGLLVAFTEPLLLLWVGPEFVKMAMVMRVLIVHLCFNLAVLPLFSVQIAMNKVRWPGLVTLFMGILNVFLAMYWVGWGQYGLGVAVAGAVILTLKNAVFTPLYASRIQRLPWFTYLNDLLPGIIATVIVWFISSAIAKITPLDSWLHLGVATVPVVLLWFLFSYAFYFRRLNTLFSDYKNYQHR